jgi:hypothetical protein
VAVRDLLPPFRLLESLLLGIERELIRALCNVFGLTTADRRNDPVVSLGTEDLGRVETVNSWLHQVSHLIKLTQIYVFGWQVVEILDLLSHRELQNWTSNFFLRGFTIILIVIAQQKV